MIPLSSSLGPSYNFPTFQLMAWVFNLLNAQVPTQVRGLYQEGQRLAQEKDRAWAQRQAADWGRHPDTASGATVEDASAKMAAARKEYTEAAFEGGMDQGQVFEHHGTHPSYAPQFHLPIPVEKVDQTGHSHKMEVRHTEEGHPKVTQQYTGASQQGQSQGQGQTEGKERSYTEGGRRGGVERQGAVSTDTSGRKMGERDAIDESGSYSI